MEQTNTTQTNNPTREAIRAEFTERVITSNKPAVDVSSAILYFDEGNSGKPITFDTLNWLVQTPAGRLELKDIKQRALRPGQMVNLFESGQFPDWEKRVLPVFGTTFGPRSISEAPAPTSKLIRSSVSSILTLPMRDNVALTIGIPQSLKINKIRANMPPAGRLADEVNHYIDNYTIGIAIRIENWGAFTPGFVHSMPMVALDATPKGRELYPYKNIQYLQSPYKEYPPDAKLSEILSTVATLPIWWEKAHLGFKQINAIISDCVLASGTFKGQIGRLNQMKILYNRNKQFKLFGGEFDWKLSQRLDTAFPLSVVPVISHNFTETLGEYLVKLQSFRVARKMSPLIRVNGNAKAGPVFGSLVRRDAYPGEFLLQTVLHATLYEASTEPDFKLLDSSSWGFLRCFYCKPKMEVYTIEKLTSKSRNIFAGTTCALSLIQAMWNIMLQGGERFPYTPTCRHIIGFNPYAINTNSGLWDLMVGIHERLKTHQYCFFVFSDNIYLIYKLNNKIYWASLDVKQMESTFTPEIKQYIVNRLRLQIKDKVILAYFDQVFVPIFMTTYGVWGDTIFEVPGLASGLIGTGYLNTFGTLIRVFRWLDGFKATVTADNFIKGLETLKFTVTGDDLENDGKGTDITLIMDIVASGSGQLAKPFSNIPTDVTPKVYKLDLLGNDALLTWVVGRPLLLPVLDKIRLAKAIAFDKVLSRVNNKDELPPEFLPAYRYIKFALLYQIGGFAYPEISELMKLLIARLSLTLKLWADKEVDIRVVQEIIAATDDSEEGSINMMDTLRLAVTKLKQRGENAIPYASLTEIVEMSCGQSIARIYHDLVGEIPDIPVGVLGVVRQTDDRRRPSLVSDVGVTTENKLNPVLPKGNAMHPFEPGVPTVFMDSTVVLKPEMLDKAKEVIDLLKLFTRNFTQRIPLGTDRAFGDFGHIHDIANALARNIKGVKAQALFETLMGYVNNKTFNSKVEVIPLDDRKAWLKRFLDVYHLAMGGDALPVELVTDVKDWNDPSYEDSDDDGDLRPPMPNTSVTSGESGSTTRIFKNRAADAIESQPTKIKKVAHFVNKAKTNVELILQFILRRGVLGEEFFKYHTNSELNLNKYYSCSIMTSDDMDAIDDIMDLWGYPNTDVNLTLMATWFIFGEKVKTMIERDLADSNVTLLHYYYTAIFDQQVDDLVLPYSSETVHARMYSTRYQPIKELLLKLFLILVGHQDDIESGQFHTDCAKVGLKIRFNATFTHSRKFHPHKWFALALHVCYVRHRMLGLINVDIHANIDWEDDLVTILQLMLQHPPLLLQEP